MRPKPLQGEPLASDPRYVRDPETGLVWHRCEYRVLYLDTDRSGAVYHAHYLRYFEVGRTSLLRDAHFSYRTVEDRGFVYPVVRLGLKFHSPLAYDATIWVHTRFQPPETVCIGFDYAITTTDSPEIACSGFTVHCATVGGRPVLVDPMTRRAYEEFPE
jgi:acyl-CoA thioester hydrolase